MTKRNKVLIVIGIIVVVLIVLFTGAAGHTCRAHARGTD